MMTSNKSQASIDSALREALSRFNTGDDSMALTDIHLLPDAEAGELRIYNDDDELLAKAEVDEFKDYQPEEFYTKAEQLLKSALKSLRGGGLLERLSLVKPYSFVLIGEDKETVAELMMVDDADTMLLDDALLKGLDEELDAFLKDLMK